MTDLLPLVADGTRVGGFLAAMYFAYWVTSRAYKDATERYRITADEEQASRKEFEAKFHECVKRLANVETELALARIRGTSLETRISQLEEYHLQNGG